MGVGAREIGMGGAVVASTNDIYSAYWNPAGLAELKTHQITISRQLDSELTRASFVSIALRNKWLPIKGYKTTFALSWLPRLHIKASGNYKSSDFESIFVRYALPGLPEDFDGELESKTRDTRFSFSIAPDHDARWALGFNIGRVHCKTDFCGVFANDPGVYTAVSTDAFAYTFGFGAKYIYNDKLTFGMNINDVNTDLDVEIIETKPSGSTVKTYKIEFPASYTFGASYQYKPNLLLTTDFQFVQGKYGNDAIDFKIIRAGLEKTSNRKSYRLGLIVPLSLKSESSKNVKDDLPAPFFMSAGIGWKTRSGSIDFAIYPHPVMSYTRQTLDPSAELSLTMNF
jgi:long-subunit fatty acid transport protein